MASRVFGAMSSAGVSIVLITQSSSEYSIQLLYWICWPKLGKAETSVVRRVWTWTRCPIERPVWVAWMMFTLLWRFSGWRYAYIVVLLLSSSLLWQKWTLTSLLLLKVLLSALFLQLPLKIKISKQSKRDNHENLFNSKHFLDVFVVGVGGVGGELVDQIQRQQRQTGWKRHRDSRMRLANSKVCC